MATELLLIQALSPVHAGTGHAVDVIDLPIAREMATGLPYLPGSSIKGALRASHRDLPGAGESEDRLFGPRRADGGADEAATFAGALTLTDAQLLLFPVRSERGVFALATCPLGLRRLARGFDAAGQGDHDLARRATAVVKASQGAGADTALVATDSVLAPGAGQRISLEDFEFAAKASKELEGLGRALARALAVADDDYVTPRLCLLSDQDFADFAERCTEVRTRVAIDEKTRTVKDGALWNEESLPAEAVLVAQVQSSGDRKPGGNGARWSAQRCLDALWQDRTRMHHTFGGKETTGHGRTLVHRLAAAQRSGRS